MAYENSEEMIALSWLVEGHILLLDIKVDSMEQAAMYDQLIVDKLDSTPNTVDLIIRMPTGPLRNPPSLKQLTSFQYQKHPRLGYVVMVGIKTNPVARFLVTTMASIRGLRIQAFETMDEAVTFIKRMRDLSV